MKSQLPDNRQITGDDWHAILAACRSGEAVLMRTVAQEGGGTRKIWMLRYHERRLAFMINAEMTAIITLLPADYFAAGQARKRGAWRARSKRKFPSDLNDWNLP